MKTLLILLTVMFCAACGGNAQPIITTPLPSPTPNVAPSNTPTLTPTIEVLPTVTLAPTDTLEPVADVAAVNVTPTSPLQPTFTQAPATQTATFSAQNAGIDVEYFITNADNFVAGDTITLFWRVNGVARVRLFRLDPEGNRLQVWNLNSEGRLTLSTDPETEANGARFLLEAEANGITLEESLTVETSGCSVGWFFAPPPAGCPNGIAQPTVQVSQNFENGIMIWVELSQTIYVLYSDGTWDVYDDTFEAGINPERDDSLSPPPEQLQPVRGFGLVWRENTTVRDQLGWATTPEVGYDGIVQTTGVDAALALYLRGQSGEILRLAPELWEIITASPEPTPTPESTAEATEES